MNECPFSMLKILKCTVAISNCLKGPIYKETSCTRQCQVKTTRHRSTKYFE